jgi:tetratricopeptide (TPR) repeat protein
MCNKLFNATIKSMRCNSIIRLLFLLACSFAMSKGYANGLPGEYLLTDKWRNLSMMSSGLTNPALLTEKNYMALSAVASLAPDAVSRLWNSELIVPVGLYRTIGVGVTAENGHPVQNYSPDFVYAPVSTNGEALKNDNYAIVLSYASNVAGRFSYGVNAKMLYQSNFNDPRYGAAIDIGCTYRLVNHPFVGYHLAGLHLQNAIATDVNSYSTMSYPRGLSLLYSISLVNNKVKLHAKADLLDILTDKKVFIDTETMEKNLSVLADLSVLPMLTVSGGAYFDVNKTPKSWMLGFTINTPQLNSGRDMLFAYQLTNFTSDNLRGSHSLYLRFEFGKHREEVFARRFAAKADIRENELYNKAMKLFFKGYYWDAYFVFKQLRVTYPNFYKNDNATYYSGLCLEKLDFREEALNLLVTVKTQYPSSGVIPGTELAIMRIYYRNSNFAGVADQFQVLEKSNAPDSIRMHGYYLMGQTDLLQKENQKAVQYLNVVPETHPDYCFAQFSAAVARYRNGDDFTAVMNHIENCIGTVSSGKELDEIKNKAYVFAGMIYYEENVLSKAAAAFKLVPSTSACYEDAQLGFAWAAVKSRQWNDCINAGAALADITGRPVLKAEGFLLQSYAFMIQKKYDNALAVLEKAEKAVSNYYGLSDDTLFSKKFMYDNVRMTYMNLGERIKSDQVTLDNTALIESMHQEQLSIRQQIDSYLAYNDECLRLSLFNLTLETVKEDIDFTMSKLKKIMFVNNKSIQNNLEKSKELDEKIDQLKNQVDKLKTSKP